MMPASRCRRRADHAPPAPAASNPTPHAIDGEKAFWRWEVYRRKVVLEAGTLYGNADNAKNAAEAAIIRLSHTAGSVTRDSDSE